MTDNVKDFPQAALAPWGIEAKDADTFVLDQISFDKSRVQPDTADRRRTTEPSHHSAGCLG
ncbi:hypothetical protein [Kibdelosporangium aridum]|uniref:hypothetical protein n=1 Tax=Kibdelosporangium aridum TaxID=2030 RepID=UPI0035EB0D7C